MQSKDITSGAVFMCLAVPGEIISIEDDTTLRMGRVSFGGAIKQVCLAYVPEAQIGDYAIVHAGFALSILDREAAVETLDYIRQLSIEDKSGLPEV